jgi:hypothetical protein
MIRVGQIIDAKGGRFLDKISFGILGLPWAVAGGALVAEIRATKLGLVDASFTSRTAEAGCRRRRGRMP